MKANENKLFRKVRTLSSTVNVLYSWDQLKKMKTNMARNNRRKRRSAVKQTKTPTLTKTKTPTPEEDSEEYLTPEEEMEESKGEPRGDLSQLLQQSLQEAVEQTGLQPAVSLRTLRPSSTPLRLSST